MAEHPAPQQTLTLFSYAVLLRCSLTLFSYAVLLRCSDLGALGIDSVKHARGINERGSRIHGDRDAQRLSNLFFCGSGLQRRFAVHHDAAVAPRRDRNG